MRLHVATHWVIAFLKPCLMKHRKITSNIAVMGKCGSTLCLTLPLPPLPPLIPISLKRSGQIGFFKLAYSEDCLWINYLLKRFKETSSTIWEKTPAVTYITFKMNSVSSINPYPTAFPYGNGMVLHFYQQQESSTTKTVHKVINKGLKAYV